MAPSTETRELIGSKTKLGKKEQAKKTAGAEEPYWLAKSNYEAKLSAWVKVSNLTTDTAEEFLCYQMVVNGYGFLPGVEHEGSTQAADRKQRSRSQAPHEDQGAADDRR
ncbi:hypothetical protein QP568_04025 [Propionimicrobium lymphophilum]|uniref:hypothetical protein n=1 Tax=Propionimicrobium TaxID=203133 RepID=UPI0003D79967|nr:MULTISPECIES: hypothetical protein [Propionimicrobium]ETJ97002.1 hypothetical protein HMPREF1255_0995 [Propionimicrobium sp. BV2F7]MDK7709480.1 hypothetical protein [Propionimicrobium lymphophilum]MDK7733466.1 hypothetical protein [Propionimicrobium lymphophilum]